jgi:hypothetical protein
MDLFARLRLCICLWEVVVVCVAEIWPEEASLKVLSHSQDWLSP